MSHGSQVSGIKQAISAASDALGYMGIYTAEIAAEVLAAVDAELARRWPAKPAPQPIDLDAIFGKPLPIKKEVPPHVED